MKAMQYAGIEPVVLDRNPAAFAEYYQMACVHAVHAWEDFLRLHPLDEIAGAALMDGCRSVDALVALKWQGVRVGLFAASTALRKARTGRLDFETADGRGLVASYLAESVRAASCAASILERVRPDTVMFLATEYTPEGELFDCCLNQGVEAIGLEHAHRNNALVLKRFSAANRNDHVWSLSDRTWARVKNLVWSDDRREAVRREIEEGYASGTWYGACRTQFNTSLMDAAVVRGLLGVDTSKKTAVIFAPILWDAPFSWSASTLFPTYEEWLVETVRGACRNDSVNWIIKIHPANLGKRAMEGYADEPAETRVLSREFGNLPSHVKVLPPDSPMSTYSLFQAMDYCITVRGTVGIEAATLGIPVITAAVSRYSGKGFTVDSTTRDEYLERLARIAATPRLSPARQELAQRFAYGLFVLRPLAMHSVTWDHGTPKAGGGARQGPHADIHLSEPGDWGKAADLTALTSWMRDSHDEDFVDEPS